MPRVRVDKDLKVAIPPEIGETVGIAAGVEVELVALNGHLHLVPVRPISEMRGFLKGMDTTLDRDDDRL